MSTSIGSSRLAQTMRWLEEEAEEAVVMVAGKPENEYPSFGGEDDDDEYIFETWEFWTIVMVMSLLLALLIFYFSYKQELCCGIHKDEEDHGEADIENGKKLQTKTFQDSKAFERLPEQELKQHMMDANNSKQLGNGTDTTGGTATSGRSQSITTGTPFYNKKPSNMHTLIAAPRCVLCSKPFEIGENVTHSTACHHEFHETCLKKYWADPKNRKNGGKCPVCKVEYVVEELAPSKHFSSHMMASGSQQHQQHGQRRDDTETGHELGPFEELEEEENKDA